MLKKYLNVKKTINTIFMIILLLVTSCKDDDTRSCTNCNSPQTQTFEVCEESNGNASVNGEDTGVRYDIYIADLEAAGVNCGG